ncbi:MULTISPECIES: fasciclin domain-containing protein [unclassified Sulfitobacter]|uniref:fasciclin domain-containing protein n=1 Tax=unclassified Sulfitobacter TaxID=196795 RepID=UPI0007C31C8A|nr:MULTISPECIES: fasciclin domain-containing protein [unclassified Sulfitobacter]KZX94127.1 fasciclin [Sulfitobacter sp. HI0023]KZY25380.1 fasciclin [Sulfitobacter sp. HI0040]KZZ69368.1 fasciclin [Sulfitobacter sp. HI0129]
MTIAKSMMTAAAIALTAGVAHAENPMVGGAEMFANMNIVENAVNSADHTTLVAAVQAAGLAETLSGPGPFTVFAPTNAAFDRLTPEGTVEELLKPENKAQLTELLTCHVVDGAVMSDAIKSMIADHDGIHPIETLGGCTLNASMADDGRILLGDENQNGAFVEIADVVQSNGVIHVIDGVIVPENQD